ncbi:MAG: hypothetical protein APF80_02710 [Alphaproteobacteria bacterium BRH_c36]|nr:MAG: hypothetical protein APF80_02710 [Alphaproteobacteria bacterium BRH_c36]
MVKLSIPLELRRGDLRHDEEASLWSAFEIMKLIERFKPVANSRWLDFGCGVKMAQALYEHDNPQDIYVGLDVFEAQIEHLKERLAGEPKFAFATVPFQNNMYNKQGEPMTSESVLPVPVQEYDLLTMFSVVTHMEPHHTSAILKILRKYAAPDARLVFSCFADENQEVPFYDEFPDKPLMHARYRKSALDEFISDAKWETVYYGEPIEKVIRSHYVCRPV